MFATVHSSVFGRLSFLFLLLTVLSGCGGSHSPETYHLPDSASDNANPRASAGTVLVQFADITAQTDPAVFRFIGLDQNNRVLFGPQEQPHRPVVTLRRVPIEVTTLVLIPLQDGQGYDAFAHSISLEQGRHIVTNPLKAEARPTSISVSPTQGSLKVGETTDLTAVGTFSNRASYPLTDTVEWSAAPAESANVTAGRVEAKAGGPTVITARLHEVRGLAELSILALETALTLESSVSPSVSGQALTLTASLTSPTGTPQGEVVFRDGETVLGTSPADSQGKATFTTSALEVGVHSLQATFVGSPTHQPSTSQLFEQTVNQRTAGVSLGSSANPAVSGQSVTLTGIVTSDIGTPTGTLQFFNGSTPLGSPVALNANGQATLNIGALPIGSHSFTAAYSGDTKTAPFTSLALVQQVNQSATSTALTTSVKPSGIGQPITLTATVSASAPGSGTATGSVTFRDGSTELATVALNSGTAEYSFTPSSSQRNFTAAYNGSSDFANSVSSVHVQEVGALYVGGNSGQINAFSLTENESYFIGRYLQEGQLRGLDFDSSGTLYFTSISTNRVYRKRPGQAAEIFVDLSEQGQPMSELNDLACDSQGYVYVNRMARRDIVRISPDGDWEVFFQIPPSGILVGLAVDSADRVYCSTSVDGARLYRLTYQDSGPPAQEILPLVPDSSSRCLDIDSAGTLYVGTNLGIYSLSPGAQNWTTVLTVSDIQTLAVDGTGNVYYSIMGTSQVHRILTGTTDPVVFATTTSHVYGLTVY